MRTIRFLLSLSIISLSFLCQGQYILTLHCTQMDAYLGKSLHVRVTEIGSGWEVGRRTLSPIETADFSMELYVLLAPHSYNVDFYVDENNNGVYDAPPADHAWRRVLNSPAQNTTIDFIPDQTWTDITFPNPFPYSTYNAIWGGRWNNLTFGSTDTIEAGFNVRCDSILAFFRTKGVFGNPAVVEYHSNNPRPADTTFIPDTLRYQVTPPWSGEIYITNSELHADLHLAVLGFQVTGTIGAKQVLAHYKVLNNGVEFANGYFYVRELEVISSKPTLEAKLDQLSDISCHGLADGSITLNPIGGTPSYSYLWSTSATTPGISSLTAGTYSVTVTDSEGCIAKNNFTITDPELFFANINAVDASCFDICDGTIDLEIFGGVPPYNINIPDSLCPGTYPVTITDDHGCLFDTTILINSPNLLLVDVIATDVSCFGACDGTIQLTIVGGTPPFNINTPDSVCTGLISVLITDANGCLIQTEVFIGSPEPIIILDTIIIHATEGQSNGEIQIVASGGNPPLVYSIDGGVFQLPNIFTGLPEGTHVGSIKDGNGCILEFEFEIQNITALEELAANFSLYPNPASTEIHLQSDLSVSIEMMDINGQQIRKSEFSDIHDIGTANLPRGVYILKISDGFGSAFRKIVLQ